jgi:hypothetical protein
MARQQTRSSSAPGEKKSQGVGANQKAKKVGSGRSRRIELQYSIKKLHEMQDERARANALWQRRSITQD